MGLKSQRIGVQIMDLPLTAMWESHIYSELWMPQLCHGVNALFQVVAG